MKQLPRNLNLIRAGSLVTEKQHGIRNHLRGILERNLKEKPLNIYEEFISSYNGKYPKDLPMIDETNEPDDTKIKQALQRFKRNIESKIRKDVLM